MFYLKYKGKKLWIEEDNTFTTCPRCGKEMQVDLGGAVVDGVLDLYGLIVFCPECSRRLMRKSCGIVKERFVASEEGSPLQSGPDTNTCFLGGLRAD